MRTRWFVLGDEALNALDAAAEGKDFIVHSSRVALNSEDGAQYAIAVLNNSDRQSVDAGLHRLSYERRGRRRAWRERAEEVREISNSLSHGLRRASSLDEGAFWLLY